MARCKVFTLFTMVLASGCSLRGELGLEDNSAVQTPVYTANKVLFLESKLDGQNKPIDPRHSRLSDGYELVDQARTSERGLRRSVKNRQPISILVSRAYIPSTAKTCNRRNSDILFGGNGRDIAVLLDVSTSSERQDFIAVWYQRDVPPNETLSFQDLLVYSSDAWDAKYPPFFRLRLVDVSSERNTAVGALLDQVRSSSSSITSLLGVPGGAPVVGIAALAARQVLAHEKNKALVDFTFQLYGEHLLSEAGGVPLGILQTGGMVVTAPPCDAGNGFWENSLEYDHRLGRIEQGGAIQPMPYVFATVLSADLSVPQIVKTRSAAIMKRLTDPQIAQTEIDEALKDVTRLDRALQALNARETYRRRPSKEAFKTLVSNTSTSFSGLDSSEQAFFLTAFYQVTGRSLSTPTEYLNWLTNCSDVAKYNTDAARFEVDKSLVGVDTQKCWPE
jgi:hypothetical protein